MSENCKIEYDSVQNVYLNIEHRESNKVYGCKIPLNKYVNVFNSVFKNWNRYLNESSQRDISVADIIKNNYKIPYAAAADIANSISLSKSINGR